MPRALLLPLILLTLCAWVSPASAGKRVALIIGNSAYRNVPQLANPANDAKLIASTLKAAGFDLVDLRADLTAGDMRRALRDFGDQAKTADVAVIYYAGHGIEVDGNNYLIPTDAVLERDTDVYDEALSLDRVLVAIEPAKQLRLVILDACRDNPFGRNMKQASTRSIARGLAKIEPMSPNTLIAFSAKAGSTANDGDGGNSPFTQALAKRIATPGLDVRRAFGFVRDDVLKVTGNRQEPYVYGSLGGDDVPLVPAKAEPVVAPAVSQADGTRKDYELAVQVGTPDGWNAFLSQYPTGFYANLARAQLNKLTAEQAQRDAEERARIARDAQARLAAQNNATRLAQANADADAKAAEQARADAERKRVAANAVVADAERAAPLADTTRPGADTVNTQKMAALPPVTPPPVDGKALTRRLQSELARVGCYDGAADGNWTTKTRSALDNFNRRAGTSFDVTEASSDAADAVHRRDGKVCVAARSDDDAKPAKRREQPEKRVQQSKRSGGRCFVMSGQSFCQ